jgi:hypothetical protein
MLFFVFVIAFVSCACVLVPLVCLGIGAFLRQGRKSLREE